MRNKFEYLTSWRVIIILKYPKSLLIDVTRWVLIERYVMGWVGMAE